MDVRFHMAYTWVEEDWSLVVGRILGGDPQDGQGNTRGVFGVCPIHRELVGKSSAHGSNLRGWDSSNVEPGTVVSKRWITISPHKVVMAFNLGSMSETNGNSVFHVMYRCPVKIHKVIDLAAG